METESQSGGHLSGKPCDGGQPCPPLRLNHPLGLCEGASFRAPPWMEDYQDYLLPGTYHHPRSPALSPTLLPLPPLAVLPSCPVRLLVVSIPNGRPWSHTHAHLQALFPLHQTNAQLASSRGYKSKLPLHRLFQPAVCHHSKHHQRLPVLKGRLLLYILLSSWTLCLR